MMGRHSDLHAMYRQHRADGHRPQQALLIARHELERDRLDWHPVPSPADGGYYYWDSIGWDGPHGMTVRVDVTDDPDFTIDDADCYRAATWPVEDRAAWNRRAGMAKGPAWQQATTDYRRDLERENDWRFMGVRVVVTLPNGATGEDSLWGVDTLESWGYTKAWRNVIDVVLGNGMVDEAVRDAVRSARDMVRSTLPPQYRAPRDLYLAG